MLFRFNFLLVNLFYINIFQGIKHIKEEFIRRIKYLLGCKYETFYEKKFLHGKIETTKLAILSRSKRSD